MKAIGEELKVQSTLIHEVFPPKADVYYIFADRVFEDVVSPAACALYLRYNYLTKTSKDCRIS